VFGARQCKAISISQSSQTEFADWLGVIRYCYWHNQGGSNHERIGVINHLSVDDYLLVRLAPT
jgi:hypothetical protein